MPRHIPIIEIKPDALAYPERRTFLKIMAASMALAGAGCKGPPQEEIVPYVQMPELLVPGQPLFYATACMRQGYANGVLVESNMGRPTKVEGNPHHPSSLGATDVFAQASILQLWDPDRSQTVRHSDVLSTWNAFITAFQSQRAALNSNNGAGLRILTGNVTSPMLRDQLTNLLQRYPAARWHSYEPLHDEAAYEAATLVFERPLDTILRFDRAAVVLVLDADVFGDWPGCIRYARDFTQQRKSNVLQFSNRLYVIEAAPTLTGAIADQRLALPPHEMEGLLWRVASQLKLAGINGDIPAAPSAQIKRWEEVLVKQLAAHRGTSLIVAGGSISAPTRALVHMLNLHLNNVGQTLSYIAPVVTSTGGDAGSIAELTSDMDAGKVQTLLMLGANPVYNTPADINFAQAFRKVPFSIHLGLYRDETARLATWHIPQSHGYEQWSDGRAYDGTASIVQPVMMPLYGGRSAHQLLALLSDDAVESGHDLVQRYWRKQRGTDDFDLFWQTSLRQGIVQQSASSALDVRPKQTLQPPTFQRSELAPLFIGDASTGDGELANNAWLQELPRPFTKLTWDNAAMLSAETAKTLDVQTGDVVRLSIADHPALKIEAPIWILPGHSDRTITLPLGYGRWSAGSVGNDIGFNAYRLKMRAASGGAHNLHIEKIGRHHEFATTQGHATMEGRDLVRMATLEEFRRNPHFANERERDRVSEESLYPPVQYRNYKWGMAIDLNTCIGCNACTIACQAENNIPVVGKEEVIRGREMHWIRVDRYYTGSAAQPRTAFLPVPCMHCENAPCEEVCPVGAAVHDSEGLNVQVYNRCVGTRFCSNNCPYKVRRFNFLQYANTTVESLKALQNPEVTVRRRGVMEKCTYCLQRITRARLDAEKLGRRVRDGEVVTACQAVCPTEAIVFGDLNDPASKVNRAKASPLNYTLLAELNTHPRTTYAARVINTDPDLE
jgi:Fe-S-cluster-containing dehydrogenase component